MRGSPVFLNDDQQLQPALQTLLYYIFYIGGVFGAFAAGFLCDYGRKPAIISGAGITLISAGILTGSVDLAMFLIFRFLTGFGCVCWRKRR